MSSATDYAAMLRVWPAVRERFAGYSSFSEGALYSFFQHQLPHFSHQMWLAGMSALLRNGLLYQRTTGSLSFLIGDEPQVFEPVIEYAWRQLWQELKTHLTFPLGCLWSTGWLQPVIPPHQPVLVLEVNWSEVRAATHLVARQNHYLPVETLTQDLLASSRSTPPLVLVRRRQRASPIQLLNAVATARLEKMIVDLPAIFPTLNLTAEEWLLRVQHYYQVDTVRLERYRAQVEKQRVSNSKY